MLLSLLPESLRPRLVPVEATLTLFCALCWKVLAFAMYAEGYDLDPSAPVQPAGDDGIELFALVFACSVPVTWLLARLLPRVPEPRLWPGLWPRLRPVLDDVIVLRLGLAVALSLVMFLGLLTGARIPLLGWRI